jgi:DUF971 family protein
LPLPRSFIGDAVSQLEQIRWGIEAWGSPVVWVVPYNLLKRIKVGEDRMSEVLRPVSLSKEGDERLVIQWSDGHRGVYSWTNLRKHCPCAGCQEERQKPADPFRILKPAELQPLKPVAIAPVGFYAYKITWNDGHDTGIFTLENLRTLCECSICSQPQ